jgi:hypothetical protein
MRPRFVRAADADWSLDFEVSLELGAWDLLGICVLAFAWDLELACPP